MTSPHRPAARALRALAVVALASLAGCGGGQAAAKKPVPPVHLVRAETGVVPAEVIGIGSMTPVTSVAIKSRVDGQIVAVRDEDGEATLKKLYREKNRIRLEPANKTMKPIYRDRVDILGVLVGVVRKY